MPEVSERRDIDEVIAQAASTMEVLARALHVRDAQLQPTLDAIVSAAASALNAGRDAGLILLERGKLVPRAATGRARSVSTTPAQTCAGRASWRKRANTAC